MTPITANRSPLPGLGALLLAAGIPAPGTALAVDPPPTCEGREPTIVSTDGRPVQGTEGDDVIVAVGASRVLAGGGDDLVCYVAVDGPGLGSVWVALGAGADTYVAGAGDVSDRVWTGEAAWGRDGRIDADGARDVVDVGAGDDEVFAGSVGGLFEDVVRLGPGADEIDAAGDGMTPDASIDLGAEPGNLLRLHANGPAALAVDGSTRSATLGGASAWRWDGLASSYLLYGGGPVDFTGTDADESLLTDAPRRVRLGGGDDLLSVLDGRIPGPTSYDGGAGHDELELRGTAGRTVADLAARRLRLPGVARPVRLRSIDEVDLTAQRLTVTGTGRAVRIRVQGCRIDVAARGGDDRVVVYRVIEPSTLPWTDAGCRSDSEVSAGRGNDVVLADIGDDVLRGGPGRDRLVGRYAADRVLGGAGLDRCEGERRTGCERRATVPPGDPDAGGRISGSR